jgi:hypothetical protein
MCEVTYSRYRTCILGAKLTRRFFSGSSLTGAENAIVCAYWCESVMSVLFSFWARVRLDKDLRIDFLGR